MKLALFAFALGAVCLLGCNREPQRGIIRMTEEKDKDGNLFRKYEYYLNAKGQKIPHGKLTQYFPSGEVKFQGQMLDGKQDGEWIEYNIEGKIVGRVSYKEGQPHGPLTVLYPSGKMKVKGANIEGLQDGEWVWYDEEGNVTKRELWKEGENVTNK